MADFFRSDDNLEPASVDEHRRRALQDFENNQRRLGLIPQPEVSSAPFRMPPLLGPEATPEPGAAAPAETPPGPMAAEVAGAAQPKRSMLARGIINQPAVQAVAGVLDMVRNTTALLKPMDDWMRQHGLAGVTQRSIPQIPRATTWHSNLVRGASQFLSAFGLVYWAVPSLAGVGATSTAVRIGAAAFRGEVAGVIADLAAFDGHEPRMSNMLKALPPALGGPLFAWLAADPTDTEAEGRFKNAVEGVLAGQVLNGFFLVSRVIVRSTGLRAALQRGPAGPLQTAASKGDDAIEATAGVPPQTAGVRQGDSFMDVPLERLTAEPETVASAAATQARAFVEERGLTDAIPGVDIPPRMVDEVVPPAAPRDVPADVPVEARAAPVDEPPADIPSQPLTPQEMATALHEEGLLSRPSVDEMADLLQERELVPPPLPTGRNVPDTEAELKTVIRNHGGIKLTEGATGIETELRDIIGIRGGGREGGRAGVTGLMNNQTGMSPLAMAEVLKRSGHVAEADVDELLGALDRSVRVGQPVISNYNTAYLERELYQDDALTRTWKDLKELQRTWDDQVAIQRRTLERTEAEGGSRAAARTEAEALRSGQPMGPGLPPGEITINWIKRINPGATMNDAQAIALIETIVETANRTVRAAAKSLETESVRDVTTALSWLHMQGEIQPKSLGIVTELGRGLSAMNDPTKAYNTYLQQFETLFATQRNMTPRQFMEKLAGVKSIEELQQLAQRTRNVIEDGRLAGGNRTVNALLDIWTSSILSSPMGRVADAASNAIVQAMAIPERQLAALYGDVPVGEATQLGYGMVAQIPAAFRVLGEVLRRGESAAQLRGRPTKFEVHQLPPEPDEVAANLFTLGLEYLGGALRGTVGRVMLGADEFATSISGAGQMRALAYRQAVVDEGLRGADAWRRVNEILANPSAGLEGQGQAFGEALTMRAPLLDPEAAFARMGLAAQRFQDVMMRIPALRLVAPFVRTPTNILRFALERTPAALMSGQVRNALRKGGPEASMVMAKMQLGTGLLTTAALLASQGTITGRGPSNPELRKQWLNTHQPYSIKVGNTWHAYQRLDPYGMLIGLAADFQNLAGEMLDDNPEGADRLAIAAMAAIWTNLSSKTYVQGLSRLFDALNTTAPGSTIRDLERLVTNIGVGFIPFSGTLSGVARAEDNVRRRTDGVSFFDTLYRTAAARIPGWGADLPPYRNVWGDPVLINGGWAQRMTSPIYTKDATPNPLDDELLRLQFPLSLPPRSLHAGDQLPGFEPPSGTRASVKLTPEQWDQYILFQAGIGLPGLTLRERGARLIASADYQGISDGAKRSQWHRLIHDQRVGARTRARQQLLQKFPELQLKIRARQQELRTLGATPGQIDSGREAITNRLRATGGTSSIPREPSTTLRIGGTP